jgi:SAM-dependent methyltransferase
VSSRTRQGSGELDASIHFSVYDQIYLRREQRSVLDDIDEMLVQDPELVSYQCSVGINTTDLTRYGELLSQAGAHYSPMILDHGCGVGGVGAWLSMHFELRVIGLDYSRIALHRARRLFMELNVPRLNFVCCDFANLPWRAHSFGGAIALESLYMAPAPWRALRKLHFALEPGAPLILTVLCWDSPRCAKSVPGQADWLEMLPEAGFRIMSVSNMTDAWRTLMTKKHRLRLEIQDRVLDQLGPVGIAELRVSSAMLGFAGGDGVIANTERFEFIAAAV